MAKPCGTVLLIDDDIDHRCVIAHCIREAGFNVISAESVKDGVEILAESSVDLIVSDIRMSEIDGYHLRDYVLSHLRDPMYARIPIILVSASLELMDEELESCQVNYFCSKREIHSVLARQITEAISLHGHSERLSEIKVSIPSNT